MINNFSNFASSIVASIIALTIVEMILPNNKTKKYITFVATMILSIVIINPIVTILNKDISFENVFEQEVKELSNKEYTAQMEYAKQKSIDEMYDKALKQDIITRLEDNGYKVNSVYFTIDRSSYQPIKMELEIEHYDGDIQKIVIDVSKNYDDDISLFEVAKVKDILYEAYRIDRKNIKINNK